MIFWKKNFSFVPLMFIDDSQQRQLLICNISLYHHEQHSRSTRKQWFKYKRNFVPSLTKIYISVRFGSCDEYSINFQRSTYEWLVADFDRFRRPMGIGRRDSESKFARCERPKVSAAAGRWTKSKNRSEAKMQIVLWCVCV